MARLTNGITIFKIVRTLMLKYLLFLFFVVKLLPAQNSAETTVIIQFNNTTNAHFFQEKFKRQFSISKFSVKEILCDTLNIWTFNFDEKMTYSHLSYLLFKCPEVISFQQIKKITYRNLLPNDPSFSLQWNLFNNGNMGGDNDVDIDAELAWQFGTGKKTVKNDTIVIGVVDVGFDLNHEDLLFWKNNQEIRDDNIDNDNNGYIDDYDGWNIETNNGKPHNVSNLYKGHGTSVCGAAAAIGNNSKGIAGVAYNAMILPVHLGNTYSDSIIKAYNYLIKMRQLYNSTNGKKGAYVVAINSSFGIEDSPAKNPVWCNLYDFMGSIGIINTTATDNKALNYDVVDDMPGNCSSKFIINTTYSTNTDQLGSCGFGKINVDVAVPAAGIYLTKLNNTYGALTGTSFAAPQVAGAIAVLYSVACDSLLLLSKTNPEKAALLLRDFILSSTDQKTDFIDKVSSNGRLNIYNAVTALKSYCKVNLPKPPVSEKLALYWVAFDKEGSQLYFNYDYQDSTEAQIFIYDELGKTVHEFKCETLSKGNYTNSLLINTLSSGMYFIGVHSQSAKSKLLKFVVY